MNESDYIKLVTEVLEHLSDSIEDADADHMLDIELIQGVLTITTEDNKQFVINQHLPSKQIWVSSPVSGAAHYSFHNTTDAWIDSNGNDLFKTLSADLSTFGLTIDLT